MEAVSLFRMVGNVGIEPTLWASETPVLPLDEFPISGPGIQIRTVIHGFKVRCPAFERYPNKTLNYYIYLLLCLLGTSLRNRTLFSVRANFVFSAAVRQPAEIISSCEV